MLKKKLVNMLLTKDIIAEMVSDEPKFRAWIRENFENEAKMKSEVKEDAAPADDKKDDASKDDSEAAETTDDSADAE